jgi:cation:H+ antiporter
MLKYIILIIGFLLLIKGADLFVDKATIIATKLKIPKIIIGMTIVAIGTSLPELSVSVQSSILGLNDMCVANVIGSNIFNLLMITGTIALLSKVKINNFMNVFKTFGVYILLIVLSLDKNLSLLDGIILLGVFIAYMTNMIKSESYTEEENEDVVKEHILKTIVLGLIGLAGIAYGGNLVIESARDIALSLGMSENLVGLTVVALGTSLPEYVTSIVACKKDEMDIAIGNILGSNIFNILLVLGLASLLAPISVSIVTLIDALFMFITMILYIVFTFKKRTVNKFTGIIFIMTYVAYICYTIIR